METRAIKTTESYIGDAPILPDRLDQVPEDQAIGGVTADGAFVTRSLSGEGVNLDHHPVFCKSPPAPTHRKHPAR